MELERKNLCPLRTDPETGEMKPCAQLDCAWFTGVEAEEKNGEKTYSWGCSVPLLAHIFKKNMDVTASGLTGCQAATESFRNEMMSLNGVPPVAGPQLSKRS